MELASFKTLNSNPTAKASARENHQQGLRLYSEGQYQEAAVILQTALQDWGAIRRISRLRTPCRRLSKATLGARAIHTGISGQHNVDFLARPRARKVPAQMEGPRSKDSGFEVHLDGVPWPRHQAARRTVEGARGDTKPNCRDVGGVFGGRLRCRCSQSRKADFRRSAALGTCAQFRPISDDLDGTVSACSAGVWTLLPFLTHTFSLDRITKAYELFGSRGQNVIKVAIKPLAGRS